MNVSQCVTNTQRLVRRSGRDTPSSTLCSTDSEVAYLTGTRAPSYVRPYPLSPLLRPCPPPVLVRTGRASSISHASKASRLTSASQHSLINVNELVRDVLRRTSEIEDADRERDVAVIEAEQRRIQMEQQRLATKERQCKAQRAEDLKRVEVEREKIAAEKERAAEERKALEAARTAEIGRSPISEAKVTAAFPQATGTFSSSVFPLRLPILRST